ncbi:MAG: excinuclease ABC subunit UvrC [Elusimicrobiota bacterium]
MTLKEKLINLPDRPGNYIFRDYSGQILYIGKASSLHKRVSSYFQRPADHPRTNLLVNQICRIDYLITANEKEALILENKLIKKYQPKYNVALKDSKTYPFLKITNEDFPRIQITRKIAADGAKYFGPYPDVNSLRQAIKFIRKNFLVRTCAGKVEAGQPSNFQKKPCSLNYYLGLCPGPCINKISREDYAGNVRTAVAFLKRDNKNLISRLEKEMHSAALKLNFEKAQQLKKEIEALKSTLEKIRFREVSEEEVLAHLDKTDILKDLKKVLQLKKLPCRIEAFDISNLSGKEAVGSLAVFENAEANKNEYRRFKIKTVTNSDDPQMLAEVVERRYRRRLEEKSPLPDLILIDGGLPQINTVKKRLAQLNLSGLPIIGLAKKEEEIYFPGKPQSLALPKNSRALHLLQAVRDEAHRFALAYHHLLRKKTIKTRRES